MMEKCVPWPRTLTWNSTRFCN
uniref:Uncharacterized protein n=1 Tax=Arundo donax TaxID=35708 RepID=A0A0A9AG66_ARUDO